MARGRNRNTVDWFRRWGLVAIAIPAIIVAGIVGYVVRDIALSGYGSFVSAGVNSLVGMAFQGEPFSADASEQAKQQLAQMVDSRVRQGRLVLMDAVTTDGLVIYSSDPESIGMTVDVDTSGTQALQGQMTSQVVWSDDAGIPGERARLLKVVAPIHYGRVPEPLGYVVAYREYESISGAVNRAVAAVVATVLIGATGAWVALLFLARSASKEVERREREVNDLDERLARTLSTAQRHSLGTLQALSAAVDAKDSYTARHSLLVADYSRMIAERLGWDVDVDALERAGLLHDIGKIGVPEAILQKKDLLKADEYTIVQEHSRIGADILETIPFLSEIVPAVLHHHERWDGMGYPDKLAGRDIPALARILAVADAFDAMTSDRPYRPGLSLDASIEEIRSHSGTQFDPEVASILLDLLQDGALRSPRALHRVAS
jgi:putative nucleotidyltransferase with HDIG domain